MRIRKLIGTFALFALVIVWALIAMAIAQFPPIFNNPWIAAIYYVVAGIGWVLPAMPLLRWMLTGSSGHVDRAEAVPQSGGGARDQNFGVARTLKIAVERNPRQRCQMLGMLREHDAGRVVTAVLKPSSVAIRNSRGPAAERSPTG